MFHETRQLLESLKKIGIYLRVTHWNKNKLCDSSLIEEIMSFVNNSFNNYFE